MSIDPEAFFGASARWGVGMASRPGSQSSSILPASIMRTCGCGALGPPGPTRWGQWSLAPLSLGANPSSAADSLCGFQQVL